MQLTHKAGSKEKGDKVARHYPMTPVREDGLTERQAEVLRFIVEYCIREGRPPQVREMGEALGATSPNAVYCHIMALKRNGWIVQSLEHTARRFLPAGLRFLPTYEDSPEGERLRALMAETKETV